MLEKYKKRGWYCVVWEGKQNKFITEEERDAFIASKNPQLDLFETEELEEWTNE